MLYRSMSARGQTAAQVLARTTATGSLIFGVLGFLPGVTSHYRDMVAYGAHSSSYTLGIFQVSALQNGIHIFLGALGLMMARNHRFAYLSLIFGGAVYLGLCFHGVVAWIWPEVNVLPVNVADTAAHFVFGATMMSSSWLFRHRKATPVAETAFSATSE